MPRKCYPEKTYKKEVVTDEVVEVQGKKQRRRYKLKANGNKATGRPAYTLKNLPDNWQELLMSYYEKGASDAVIYGKVLKMDYHAFWGLGEREEEVAQIVKRGNAIAQGVLEWKGIEMIDKSPNSSNTLSYMFTMKNRFPNQWNIEGVQRNLNLNASAEVKPFELPSGEASKEDRSKNLLEFYQKENDK